MIILVCNVKKHQLGWRSTIYFIEKEIFFMKIKVHHADIKASAGVKNSYAERFSGLQQLKCHLSEA